MSAGGGRSRVDRVDPASRFLMFAGLHDICTGHGRSYNAARPVYPIQCSRHSFVVLPEQVF